MEALLIEKPAAKIATPSKRQQAEEYLKHAYELRFNEITGKPEFRPFNTHKQYRALNDYYLNSLARELDSYGCPNISTALIKEILSSSFNMIVNPIKEYFENLPAYSGNKDYIKELTDTVETGDKVFYDYFKKWIVATVACAVVDEIINHTCLVFTGDMQGQFKTTWLNLLVPPKLKDYRYCGEVWPDEKDTLTLLAENLIINIDDQIHKLNKKDENALKNLITAPYVKYRRPYDKYMQEYPRHASFVASINGNEFLADTSGSRRFIPFQIIKIDINKATAIDMDNVYSQALHLFKDEFQYWFDGKEVATLNDRNQMFQIISIEEQLIIEHLEVPPVAGQFPVFKQPAILLADLQMKTSTSNKLTLRKLGEALKKRGFIKEQRRLNNNHVWGYDVVWKT
jgi:predicted P-loop ATPase